MITEPSSENATAPAAARLAISDMISPRKPCVAAAITRTRTFADSRARRCTYSVTAGLSFTGSVFAMQHTSV